MKKTSDFYGFMRSKALAKAATCLLLASGGVASAYAENVGELAASIAEMQQGAKVTVKGVVKDAQGEPIIGASVIEKGTSNGSVTDFDGNFSVSVKPGATLVVSYVGYVSQEVKAGKGTISVTLEEDNKIINEVVVIGYGTQRKADVTSAVASVKAEDFAGGKIGDAAELIKGKIAGLSVTNSSGDPNAGSSIMLRGVTSLYGSITPLILVDGIEGSLTTVAPENIASIDVLKDASAAAIYGTRGASGVILITTKSGRRSAKPEVTYSNYFAFSNWTKKADFMDSHDVIMGNTGYTYDGYDTDWLKAISRKAGFKHNHSLSLRGGGENSAYSGNVTYSRDWGILRKSGNIDAKMQLDYTQFMWDDKLKFNFNVLTTRNKYDLNTNAEGYGAYRQALIRNPSSPIYNEDGSYNENFDKLQYYNPVEQQNEYTGDAVTKFMQMAGSVTVTPIKGWDTKLTLSWGEGTTSTESWKSKDYYTIALQGYNGYATKREDNWIDKNMEITSNYHNQFGQHRVEALVGYSYLYGTTDYFTAGNGDFPTSTYLWNNLGAGSFLTDTSGNYNASMTSYRDDHTLVGFFGRVSYGYADKYNVLASVRREGSSKFGANHKWGTFPSFSAGWTISNESFMKSTKNWLDNLKLRVGYGVTGREPYSSYLSQTLYSYTTDDGYKNSSVLDMNGDWVTTLTVNQNPNPELKWETSHEWNFGLDFSFLKGRIYGNVDFYVKKTKDLIWSYAVPVPPNLYASTVANVGDMTNKGIELMVTALPVKTKEFTWETTVTLSHNSNRLDKLSNQFYETDNFLETGWISDPISIVTHCMEVGHRLGDFWGLKSVGYDENGYVLVEVKDDDGNWTVKPFDTSYNEQANRQRLGNGMPQVYLGWNNTFNYKGFDLNLQFTGAFGYKILNAQRAFYENNSQTYNRLKSAADLHPASVYNAETKTLEPVYNEDGSRKMVKLSNTMQQGFWSDHLENGDFLKLANATLGYTLPLKGAITNYLSKVRLFVSTTNLFCITGYSGIDPEVATDALAPGIDDRDKYPTTRSYTFGMQVNF